MKIFYIYIFIYASSSVMRYLRYPPNINNIYKAKYCYQSITDDKIYLAVRFHPKFSDAPIFMNVDLRLNIKLENETIIHISNYYYMKLIHEKCESTLEISGSKFKYNKIKVNARFYSSYKARLIAWLNLEILPNYQNGIKACWDMYSNLMIFLNFTTNENIIPQNMDLSKNEVYNYFKNFSINAKYACAVIYGEGFVFEYKLINEYTEIPIYHSLKISVYLQSEEDFEDTYAAWPCRKPDASSKKTPTFILSSSPNEYTVIFRFKGFKKLQNNDLLFMIKNKKYKRINKPSIFVKNKYIYITETVEENIICDDEAKIYIRIYYEQDYVLEAFKVANDTVDEFVIYYQHRFLEFYNCL